MDSTARLTVVRGTNNKPVASQRLAEILVESDSISGHLFIGYPVIASSDGPLAIDALLVSPEHGVVIFDLVEGADLGDYQDRQDNSATRMHSRLLTHRDLVSKRHLLVEVTAVTFAPAVNLRNVDDDEGYPVATEAGLLEVVNGIEWNLAEKDTFERTLSALQSISTIRRSRTARKGTSAESRGAKMVAIEASIATLDALQSRAVIETVEGVQRIRGLAGSGKTIVLALKTAYLHATHPDWRIAVTFNSRALRDQFVRLINGFVIEQTGEEPNWENVRILHAWGAPGGGSREGVYHEYCVANDVQYMDFGRAKTEFGSVNAFRGACRAAMKGKTSSKSLYDAILVDEAQDFPAEFLRLCYESLDATKRLVYAYDELQNLSGTDMASAEELFGVDASGHANVDFSKHPERDIILEKCYRNSRPVLVTAHALGFGVYRDPSKKSATGLVQMFDHPGLWTEIGYRASSGRLVPGQHVRLERTPETSPLFLETHSTVSDLVQFRGFDSQLEEAEWVADRVVEDLTTGGLRYDDIILVNPDPFTTRKNFGAIRRALLDRGVDSHVAGVDSRPDVFFDGERESVVCTGIYRAKGNEAAMVYVINADESYSGSLGLARVRNRLFTAVTRSKAWVRVCGVGDEMSGLVEEFQRIVSSDFTLDFTYPTEQQREHLQIVHRDLSSEDIAVVETGRRTLSDLVSDLRERRIFVEDLDDDDVNALSKLLASRVDEK